jgi:hypothetical protein
MDRKSILNSAKKRLEKAIDIVLEKKNLERDIMLLSLLVFLLVAYWLKGIGYFERFNKDTNANQQAIVEEEPQVQEEDIFTKREREITEMVNAKDVSTWETYQNKWYGYEFKHSEEWTGPIIQKKIKGDKWEQRVGFRPKQIQEDSPFEGFDIVVYKVASIENISATEEFPKLKSEEVGTDEKCSNIEGHLIEMDVFPMEEIYVPSDDACFDSALFFTNTREEYIYILVPIVKKDWKIVGDQAEEIAGHMLEFYIAASSFNLVEISRPAPVAAKPRITAPKPVVYEKDALGRRVCNKKNDKPGKSKSNNKGKRHLDMECCLDPDEDPNPWCHYDSGKYGKYL